MLLGEMYTDVFHKLYWNSSGALFYCHLAEALTANIPCLFCPFRDERNLHLKNNRRCSSICVCVHQLPQPKVGCLKLLFHLIYGFARVFFVVALIYICYWSCAAGYVLEGL